MCISRSPSNGVPVITRFIRISAPSGAAPPASSWRRRTWSNQGSERKGCLATARHYPSPLGHYPRAAAPPRPPGKLARFRTEHVGGHGLALRTMIPVTAVTAAVLFGTSGCGGTLEGKYRRGELTTTTTTTRSPGTTATTGATTPSGPGPPASSTSTTTAPTSGNAAGRTGPGEPKRVEPDGTIVGSAAWRAVVRTSGGRHR